MNAPLAGPTRAPCLPRGGVRVLEFRYTANTFQAAEKVRFRYRLAGLDEAWIDAGNRREAHFTELRPGQYTFEVQAINHQGVMQSAPTAVPFEITLYFYQTWWFSWLCAAGAGLAIYAVVLWRLRELRKLHRLEQQIALDRQRTQIARDIHDELGASLTQIAQLTDGPAGALPETPGAEAKARRIAALAEEAVVDIGEIVWANNPRYDTLEDLVSYLREYMANYLGAAPLSRDLNFPDAVPKRMVPGPFRRHFLAVVKEALQNIVKHSQATRGEIVLILEDGRVELTPRDNGRGIDFERTPRFANGLVNMRERSHELGGSLQIHSLPQQGACVQIRVPLPAAEPR